MIKYLFFLMLVTMIESVASAFLKRTSSSGSIIKLITNINFWAGGTLYLSAALLNIYVLKFLDYSVAYPLKSMTYIWTIFLAYFFFSEKITARKIGGVALIILGAVLISV